MSREGDIDENTDTNLHWEDDDEDNVEDQEYKYKEPEGIRIEGISQVADWNLCG